jgi:hypothetical protein
MHGETQFFFGRAEAGEGEALVFVNYDSLAASVEAQELYTDATFYNHSRRFSQLATLKVIARDMVIIDFTCRFFFDHIPILIDNPRFIRG